LQVLAVANILGIGMNITGNRQIRKEDLALKSFFNAGVSQGFPVWILSTRLFSDTT
jgi:hypothetical protein